MNLFLYPFPFLLDQCLRIGAFDTLECRAPAAWRDTIQRRKIQGIERGLFFIEAGILKEERDTGNTATWGPKPAASSPSGTGGSQDTLTRMRRRSLKADLGAGSESQTFRLARLGVGWVVGTMEFFETKRLGNQVALDHCRLHHLPFSKLGEAELEDPIVALKLYKLLSRLMARQQEATVGQLATLHSIMSSPAR